uniref:PB1 domain-containing protein n=1 Tax=Syphacia muris TaxID=451379 RepID=A0A0N5ATQ5_9BILA
MGQTKSFPSRAENFPFFSLTFAETSVNIVDALPNVIDIIRKSINTYYGESVSDECQGISDYSRRLQIKRHPFLSTNPREYTTWTKRLLCGMLQDLYRCGWKIAVDSNFSIAEDISTLFFEKLPYCSGCTSSIMCLCIKNLEKIQLINAPAEMIAAVGKDILEDVHQSFTKKYDNVVEYHFSRSSSRNCSKRNQRLIIRERLLRCVEISQSLNYFYFGTAHVNGLTDCIFFIQDASRTPPMQSCCLFTVVNSKRIELYKGPSEIVEASEQCLKENDVFDIIKTSDHSGQSTLTFQLGGQWLNYTKRITYISRLATRLIQKFREIGWNVITTVSLSTDRREKPIFVLRKCCPASLPYFVLCPTGTDKIRLIDADREIIDFISNIVRQTWTIGVQCEGVENHNYCFQLADMPWNSLGFGRIFELSRMMMSRILFELNSIGWRIVCSADLTANRAFGRSLNPHCWFLDRVAYSSLNPCFSLPPLPSYDDVINEEDLSVISVLDGLF